MLFAVPKAVSWHFLWKWKYWSLHFDLKCQYYYSYTHVTIQQKTGWWFGETINFLTTSPEKWRWDDIVRLLTRLWIGRSWVWIAEGARDSSLLQNIQTSSPAHPASYSMGNRGPILGIKRPGWEADHSPPSSADIKIERSYISTPQYRPSWSI